MWYNDATRKGMMAARRLRKHCISLMADLDVQKAAYRLMPAAHIDEVRLTRYTGKKQTPWIATVVLREGNREVVVQGAGWTRKEAVLTALTSTSGQVRLPIVEDDDIPF